MRTPRWVMKMYYEACVQKTLVEQASKRNAKNETEIAAKFEELKRQQASWNAQTKQDEMEELTALCETQKNVIADLTSKLQMAQAGTMLSQHNSSTALQLEQKVASLEVTNAFLLEQRDSLQGQLAAQNSSSTQIATGKIQEAQLVIDKLQAENDRFKTMINQLKQATTVLVQKEESFVATITKKDQELSSCKTRIKSLMDQVAAANSKPVVAQKVGSGAVLSEREAVNSKLTLSEVDDDDSADGVIAFPVASSWLTSHEKQELLSQIVLDSKEENSFIRLLGKTFPTGKDAETLVHGILLIFQRHNRMIELIFDMIDAELKTCPNPMQLFRGEEFPPRMIRAFTRLTGVSFAQRVLGGLIEEIMDNDIFIKLDTRFDDETTEAIDLGQMINLCTLWCERFVEAILNSLPEFPVDFLRIARYLTQQTKQKWDTDPTAVKSAVAGFVFLRFFCPCIASPQNWGFKACSPNAMKTLLLIGKVLQCLANGVSTFKEDSLKCMDFFLIKHQNRVNAFVNEIQNWPPKIFGGTEGPSVLEAMCHKKRPDIMKNQDSTMNYLVNHTWKYNLEVSSHTRFEVLLETLTPYLQAGPDGHQTLGSSFPSSDDHPVVKGVLYTVLDNTSIISAYANSLSTLAKNPNHAGQVKEAIHHLGSLFYSNNLLGPFLKAFVRYDSYGASTEREFFFEGIARLALDWLFQASIGPWLQSVWKPIIEEIAKNKASLEVDIEIDETANVKANFDVVSKYFDRLMTAAMNNLATMPDGFWDFANGCGTYTQINNCGFRHFCINFLASVIQNPSSQVTGQIHANSLRTFGIISDMMRNVGTEEISLICNFPSPAATIDGYINTFNVWQSTQPQPVILPVNFGEVYGHLVKVVDFCLSQKKEMLANLQNEPETIVHRIGFGLNELLESLNPTSAPVISSQNIPAAGSPAAKPVKATSAPTTAEPASPPSKKSAPKIAVKGKTPSSARK